MPIRDPFHPPASRLARWESVHGGRPMVIVQHLDPLLPAGFVAHPRNHLGQPVEIDMGASEQVSGTSYEPATTNGNGGVATLAPAVTATAAEPTLVVETVFADPDGFEVRVYDDELGRRLVAAIELISPANKDRPEARRAVAAKCAALVQRGVSVSVVDLVTARHANLYAELLDLMGVADPAVGPNPPPVYAATVRGWKPVGKGRPVVRGWFQPLAVGGPLAVLPLWLRDDLCLDLDLGPSYEETCRVLHID